MTGGWPPPRRHCWPSRTRRRRSGSGRVRVKWRPGSANRPAPRYAPAPGSSIWPPGCWQAGRLPLSPRPNATGYAARWPHVAGASCSRCSRFRCCSQQVPNGSRAPRQARRWHLLTGPAACALTRRLTARTPGTGRPAPPLTRLSSARARAAQWRLARWLDQERESSSSRQGVATPRPSSATGRRSTASSTCTPTTAAPAPTGTAGSPSRLADRPCCW